MIIKKRRKIERNNTGNSGELDLSPENESLSPAIKEDLSTKSDISGDTGHTGDKIDYIFRFLVITRVLIYPLSFCVNNSATN